MPTETTSQPRRSMEADRMLILFQAYSFGTGSMTTQTFGRCMDAGFHDPIHISLYRISPKISRRHHTQSELEIRHLWQSMRTTTTCCMNAICHRSVCYREDTSTSRLQ